MWRSSLLFALGCPALAGALCAQVPGRAPAAKTYPQKLVRFHTLDDPTVPLPVRKALGQPGNAAGLPEAIRKRAAGIPVGAESITVADRAADGAWWLGSTEGAMRCGTNQAQRCDYFAGHRYLPDDQVMAIHLESDTLVWVRTRTGIARIDFRPMTLEQKAAAFEERVRLRHNRYGLLGTSELTRAGDLSSNRMFPNDNDGLWTAIYIAAESFRFAVTRQPEARRLARNSTEALMRLEQITDISGFPARAYIRKGDYRHPGGEWHMTPDGRLEWKGDTSSDEIVGHFFAYSVYYDLAAPPEEKPAIRAVVSRIAAHILDHGRYLVGPSGRPTTWGKWSPAYFADKTALGWCDAPLNSLELLSFLKTAQHITGEERFAAEYRKLIEEGYPRLAAEYGARKCELNYSDEELAMLSFYPLLEYEKDGALRRTYLSALEQWWENERREENPLWIYMYSRAMGRPVDPEKAERALARHPMDSIDWTVRNSQRRDIRLASYQDRFGRPESLDLLPPDERPVMRWNANPFRIDGGNGGRNEDDGAAFLLAYWLGRFSRL